MTETLGVIHLIKKTTSTAAAPQGVKLQEVVCASSGSLVTSQMQSDLKASGAILFETCLRKIWLFNIDENFKSLVKKHKYDLSYEGQSAYQFLLEVICGLHSPVVGETEVFGQFKEQVAKKNNPQQRLFKTIEDLVSDAKEIRRKHLTHLGSQSYGSYCRKKMNEVLGHKKHIDVIGFGSFAQSILPWVQKDETTGAVYVRNEKKHSENASSVLTKFCLKSIDSKNLQNQDNAILLICAPIAAQEVVTKGYKLVIDLRETSDSDLVKHPNVIKLKDVFAEIQKGAKNALVQKNLALNEIQKISVARNNKLTLRPFGWDDICA